MDYVFVGVGFMQLIQKYSEQNLLSSGYIPVLLD